MGFVNASKCRMSHLTSVVSLEEEKQMGCIFFIFDMWWQIADGDTHGDVKQLRWLISCQPGRDLVNRTESRFRLNQVTSGLKKYLHSGWCFKEASIIEKQTVKEEKSISNTFREKEAKKLQIKDTPWKPFSYFDSGHWRRSRKKTDTHNLVRRIGFVIPTEGSLFVKDPEAAATMNCDIA